MRRTAGTSAPAFSPWVAIKCSSVGTTSRCVAAWRSNAANAASGANRGRETKQAPANNASPSPYRFMLAAGGPGATTTLLGSTPKHRELCLKDSRQDASLRTNPLGIPLVPEDRPSRKQGSLAGPAAGPGWAASHRAAAHFEAAARSASRVAGGHPASSTMDTRPASSAAHHCTACSTADASSMASTASPAPCPGAGQDAAVCSAAASSCA